MEVHAVKTWYDQRQGVVTVEDDVLNVVRQVREIDPRIHVFYNEQSGQYDLVEDCLDGVQRLILSTPHLDARVVSRLREADSWMDGNPDHPVPDSEDFLSTIESRQEELQDEIQDRSLERVRDAGERLAWALDTAGVGYHDSIHVKRDINASDDAS